MVAAPDGQSRAGAASATKVERDPHDFARLCGRGYKTGQREGYGKVQKRKTERTPSQNVESGGMTENIEIVK